MQNDNPPHVIERTQALSTDQQILLVAAAEGDIDMITLCLMQGQKLTALALKMQLH